MIRLEDNASQRTNQIDFHYFKYRLILLWISLNMINLWKFRRRLGVLAKGLPLEVKYWNIFWHFKIFLPQENATFIPPHDLPITTHTISIHEILYAIETAILRICAASYRIYYYSALDAPPKSSITKHPDTRYKRRYNAEYALPDTFEYSKAVASTV